MRPTKSQRAGHPRKRAAPWFATGRALAHPAHPLLAAAVTMALAACSNAEPDAARAAPVAQAVAAPVPSSAPAPVAATAPAATPAAAEATGDPFAGVDPSKNDVLRNIARLDAAPAKAAPRPTTARSAATVTELHSAPPTPLAAPANPVPPPRDTPAAALAAPVTTTPATAPPATNAPPAATVAVAAPSASAAAPLSTRDAMVAGGARRAISQPRPEFPREALRERIKEGRVVATLAIAADGRVTGVVVSSAAPIRAFGRAAQEALQTWRFEPSTVATTAEVELVFRSD